LLDLIVRLYRKVLCLLDFGLQQSKRTWQGAASMIWRHVVKKKREPATNFFAIFFIRAAQAI